MRVVLEVWLLRGQRQRLGSTGWLETAENFVGQ